LAAEKMYKAKKDQEAGKFDDGTTGPRVYPVLKRVVSMRRHKPGIQ